MKQILLLPLLLFLLLTASSAQVCTNPQSKIDLHGNNILARILNGGDLFSSLESGKFIPHPNAIVEGPSTMFTAGLWLGGFDTTGNLRLSAVTYRGGGETDYFAGPLSADGIALESDCSNWDRHFKVKGSDIVAFLDSLPFLAGDPALAIAQFPSIMGWPGKGNPFFTMMWGFDLPLNTYSLAPFFDADQNGTYDPLQGDYPAVELRNHSPFVADQMIWCVFNDQGAGAAHTGSGGAVFPVEVQLTVWAFDDPAEPALNNTVFTSHKLSFRTSQPLESCYAGIWADFDIGCPKDDYVGTAPDLDAFFAYNQDAVDGDVGTTCDGVTTFGTAPPVQSATFLNVSLDKSMANETGSPGSNSAPIQFYNYLAGSWPDGTPLTYGGSGYQNGGVETNYIFPDDPADPEGWSLCTTKRPPVDWQMIGSHHIGEVLPGQVEELTVAWTVHPEPALPCGLGTTFEDIATIREIFDNNFQGGVLEAPFAPLPPSAVTLQPNPAVTRVSIRYDNLEVLEMQCFDAAGRLVGSVSNLPKAQYELDVAKWHSGVYQLRLLTSAGMTTRQLVVVK